MRTHKLYTNRFPKTFVHTLLLLATHHHTLASLHHEFWEYCLHTVSVPLVDNRKSRNVIKQCLNIFCIIISLKLSLSLLVYVIYKYVCNIYIYICIYIHNIQYMYVCDLLRF